jgi:hypothetical protein
MLTHFAVFCALMICVGRLVAQFCQWRRNLCCGSPVRQDDYVTKRYSTNPRYDYELSNLNKRTDVAERSEGSSATIATGAMNGQRIAKPADSGSSD